MRAIVAGAGQVVILSVDFPLRRRVGLPTRVDTLIRLKVMNSILQIRRKRGVDEDKVQRYGVGA
jgi:hypothetical protein